MRPGVWYLAALVAVLSILPVSGQACDPADLCVTNDAQAQNAYIALDGDLIISAGMTYTVKDSVLEFRSEDPVIRIGAGGRLVASGSSLLGDPRIEAPQGTVRLVDTHFETAGGAVGTWHVQGGTVELASTLVAQQVSLLDGQHQHEAPLEAVVSLHATDVHIQGARGIVTHGTTTWHGGTIDVSGVPITCLAGTATITGATLAGAAGISSWCTLRAEQTTISATQVGVQVAGVQAELKSLQIVSSGYGLSATAPALLHESTVQADILGVRSTSSLMLEGVQVQAPAGVQCLGSLSLRGGAITSSALALEATLCALDVTGTSFTTSAATAVRAGPGADLQGVSVTAAGPAAVHLTGPGLLSDATILSADRALVWHDGDGSVVRRGTWAAAPTCAICLEDGDYRLEDVTVVGTGTAVDAKRATLTLQGGRLDQAGMPLRLLQTQATAHDTLLVPPKHVLEDASLDATRDLRLLVRLKNGAPVAQATYSISDAGGQLASGTTGADGKGAPVPLHVFTQQATGTDITTDLRPSLHVQVQHNGLSASGPMARGAEAIVVLQDDAPPSAITGLSVTGVGAAASATWSAPTDDHVPPGVRFTLAPLTPVTGPAGPIAVAPVEGLTSSTTGHTWTLPGQGRFQLTLRAVDASGNLGAPVQAELTWDESPPLLTVAAAPEGWSRSPVRLAATATDAVSGPVTLRAGVAGVPLALQDGGFTIDRSGVHEVVVTAQDQAGNVASATRTVAVDLETPTVPTVQPQVTRLASPGRVLLALEGTPTDAVSGVERMTLEQVLASGVRTLDTFRAPYPSSTHVDLADGTHTYRLRVVDHAGNEATGPPVVLRADGTGPRLVSPLPQQASGRLEVVLQDDAALASVVVFVDGEIWSAGANETVDVDLGSLRGRHTLRIVAADIYGNTATYEQILDIGERQKESPLPWLPLLGVLGGLGAIVRRGRGDDKHLIR